MAYGRNIISRVKLLYEQQQRVAPTFSHIYGDDHSDVKQFHPSPRNLGIPITSQYFSGKQFQTTLRDFGGSISQHCSFVNGAKMLSPGRRNAIATGVVLTRNFCSRSFGEALADKHDTITDIVTNAYVDTSVAIAPAMNEVAVAAEGSSDIVAMMQTFIGQVHCFIGLSWWASIVIVTTLFRIVLHPIMAEQMKAIEQLRLLKNELDAATEELKIKGMDPTANPIAYGNAYMRVNELNKEYDDTLFFPVSGSLISFPVYISLAAAVWNLAEKVPSFKEGGMLWFTDLSTPDTTCILPILTALPYIISCMSPNPEISGTARLVAGSVIALLLIWAATLPKALMLSWLTYNLFPYFQFLVLLVKALPATLIEVYREKHV